jgi:hypothetical protein
MFCNEKIKWKIESFFFSLGIEDAKTKVRLKVGDLEELSI